MPLRMMVPGTQIEIEGRITTVTACHTAAHDMIGDSSGEVHLAECVMNITEEEEPVIIVTRDRAVAGNGEKDRNRRRCHTGTSQGEVSMAEGTTTVWGVSIFGRRRILQHVAAQEAKIDVVLRRGEGVAHTDRMQRKCQSKLEFVLNERRF